MVNLPPTFGYVLMGFHVGKDIPYMDGKGPTWRIIPGLVSGCPRRTRMGLATRRLMVILSPRKTRVKKSQMKHPS